MQSLGKIGDSELMRLCQQGNTAAFTELYGRYSKMLFNSIIRLVTETSQAEDLLQEVFIILYQDIMKRKKIDHFAAFSKRVAINNTISFLRQKKYVLQFENYENDVVMEDAVDEEVFEWKVEEVRRAIIALPQGFRTVVNLYLIEGLPQEEVAEILGISHATVRTQYHRAKKKILSSLQKEKV